MDHKGKMVGKQKKKSERALAHVENYTGGGLHKTLVDKVVRANAAKVETLKRAEAPQLIAAQRVDKTVLNSLPRIKAPNAIALGIMMPHAAHEFRYADAYTSTATLTGRPYSISEVNFTAVPAAGDVLGAGNWTCFASRNPLAASVQYMQSVTSCWQFPYVPYFADGVIQTPLQRGHVRRLTSAPATQPLCPVYLDVQDINTANTSVLHGGRVFSGSHADRTGFFVTATAAQPRYLQISVITNYGGQPWSVSAGVSCYELGGQEWRPYNSTPLPATPWSQARVVATPGTVYSGNCIIYKFVTTGWYATQLDFDPNVNILTTDMEFILFNLGAGTFGEWSILPMAGYPQHENLTRGVRTLGVSAMLSPYSSKMFRGGRAAGRQLETGMPWWLAALTTDEVGQLENATEMSFDKGIYGYMKPDCEGSFQLWNPNNYPSRPTSNDTLFEGIATRSPIYPIGGWLQLAAEVPLGETSTTAYPNGRAHFTVCWAIEFATADTWFTSRPPTCTAREFAEAVAKIRDAQQFYENPNHGKEILAFLKRTAGYAWRMAPAMLTAMRTMNPALAELATALTAAHGAVSNTGWLPRSDGW